MNENLEQVAPSVRLEPCTAFQADPDCPWCSCLSCGWSEDDHPDAVVLSLGDRRPEPVLRHAS